MVLLLRDSSYLLLFDEALLGFSLLVLRLLLVLPSFGLVDDLLLSFSEHLPLLLWSRPLKCLSGFNS